MSQKAVTDAINGVKISDVDIYKKLNGLSYWIYENADGKIVKEVVSSQITSANGKFKTSTVKNIYAIPDVSKLVDMTSFAHSATNLIISI